MTIQTGSQYGLSGLSFNLSGLFAFSPVILSFVKLVNKHLSVRLPISSIHGSPNLKWAGGRIMKNVYPQTYTTKDELNLLKDFNVMPIIVFSNHLIAESDLGDIESNRFLELFSSYKGGVIVSSDMLEKYIKKEFPDLKIHASLIKTVFSKDISRLNHYRNLELRYHKYTIHPDDNLNFDIIDSLDKSKLEVLLNERCKSGCVLRKAHYDYIAKAQLDGDLLNKSFEGCEVFPLKKSNILELNSTIVSLKDFYNLKEIGVKNFKLQGRTDNLYLYFYELIKYFFKEEELRHYLFCVLTDIIKDFVCNGKCTVK